MRQFTLSLALLSAACSGTADSVTADALAVDTATADSSGADIFVSDSSGADIAADDDAAVGLDTAADDAEADDATPPDDAAPIDTADLDIASADTADASEPDAGPTLEVVPPITKPADPLAGQVVESCSVYQDTDCAGGKSRRCELYDTVAQSWITSPDPLLERVFLYDRWYERYQAPDGQTAERAFTEPMPAGTPEATWGDPAKFGAYQGAGDSAIWSGTALTAFALRYAETGTTADYARLEKKVRQILTQFDVTGIPGYLARYHYLRVPDGSPQSPDHILRYASEDYGYKDHTFDATNLPDLPDVYRTGLPGPGGTTIPVEPMWHGNPSIDQYSGPATGLPLAWALLTDDGLKSRIATHLTCYLKRLQRIEVRNLDKNPDALAAFQALAGGGGLSSDPGDFDFTKLKTLVAYALIQPNTKNADTFDKSCPASVQLTASRILDAGADDFILQLLQLANDVGSGNAEMPGGIDHLYMSVRGGDAMHLIHMAATAYLMTGEAQYKAFAEDTAITELHALEIAETTGGFQLPDWCTSYYGHHITFTPAWSLVTMLAPGPIREAIEGVFEHELWNKLLGTHQNAKFDLMYASLDPAIATHAAEARARAIKQLETLGGNGGVLAEPRRMYTLLYDDAVAQLPAGVTPRCPTPAERARCEDGVSVFGIDVPGEPITHPCTGAKSDCPMDDGTCATAIASFGLPSNLRLYEDFVWQRDPFELGHDYGVGGYMQSPGVDLTEPYWLARHTGAITTGTHQVLAWHDLGACSQ